MKRMVIMSEYELTYQELKGLESHFRKIQSDAVVKNLKSTPDLALTIARQMFAERNKAEELSPAHPSK